MNEYTNELGVRYVAVDSIDATKCEGCAHNFMSKTCSSVPYFCCPEDRDDGRNVIWVEAMEGTLTHIELTFAATDRIDAVRNTVARLRAVYEPHFTVGKTEITRRGDHIIASIPLGAK